MTIKQTILNLIETNIRFKTPKVIKSEHADVEESLLEAICIPYQVIELDCPQQFIVDNFDWTPGPTMGIGINQMLGYAYCNGNNGTQNRAGRTSFCYDPDQPILSLVGVLGGELEHTLTIEEMPEHHHLIAGVLTAGISAGGSGSHSFGNGETSSAGAGLAHNNMPPYIISIMVQRL